MTQTRLALVLALAASACVPVDQAAAPGGGTTVYRAFNTMQVVPDPSRERTFAVVSRALAGPADFWCAAGDFAQRRAGASPTDRVYIFRGSGPSPIASGRSAVVFTTLPAPGMEDGRRPGDDGIVSLSLSEPGFNLRVAQARSYCPDSRRRLAGVGLF